MSFWLIGCWSSIARSSSPHCMRIEPVYACDIRMQLPKMLRVLAAPATIFRCDQHVPPTTALDKWEWQFQAAQRRSRMRVEADGGDIRAVGLGSTRGASRTSQGQGIGAALIRGSPGAAAAPPARRWFSSSASRIIIPASVSRRRRRALRLALCGTISWRWASPPSSSPGSGWADYAPAFAAWARRMSVNSFGRVFRFTTWGESHGPAIGAVVDGCPPGLALAEADIQPWLDRRRPGACRITSPRREPDRVRILSGVFEGRTTGTPISLIIDNVDARPGDYGGRAAYRAGHADFAYDAKYGLRDPRGGGRASARETAARVAAGAVARLVIPEVAIRACWSRSAAIDRSRP